MVTIYETVAQRIMPHRFDSTYSLPDLELRSNQGVELIYMKDEGTVDSKSSR